MPNEKSDGMTPEDGADQGQTGDGTLGGAGAGPCPECRGSGRVLLLLVSAVPCARCGGTGLGPPTAPARPAAPPLDEAPAAGEGPASGGGGATGEGETACRGAAADAAGGGTVTIRYSYHA